MQPRNCTILNFIYLFGTIKCVIIFNFSDENDTPLKSQRKDGIYEDPATPLRKKTKLSCDAGVQTEPTADNSVQNKAAQDVIDMLTSGEWKVFSVHYYRIYGYCSSLFSWLLFYYHHHINIKLVYCVIVANLS